MSILLYCLLLLTTLPTVSYAVSTTTASSASACTAYAQIDLNIMFLTDGCVPRTIVKHGFQFIRDLISIIDHKNTRVAFWTGDHCDYGKKGPDINCSAAVADTFRFDFNEHGHLSRPGQKRHQIVERLSTIENMVNNDDFVAGKKQQRQENDDVEDERIDALQTMTRPDAEMAHLGILCVALDKSGVQIPPDNITATDTLQFIVLQIFHINYIDEYGYGPSQKENATKLYELGQKPSARQPMETLLAMCKLLTNCHYVYGTVCQWSQNGTCQKNITGHLKIIKNASGTGKPCPPNVGMIRCNREMCEMTCDHKDASPWSQWSPCDVTCGHKGKRFKTRIVHPRLPSITCKTKAIEKCPSMEPCPEISPVETFFGKWQFITAGVVFLIAILVLIGTVYMCRRTCGQDNAKTSSKADKSKKRKMRRDMMMKQSTFAVESTQLTRSAKMQHLTLPMYSTQGMLASDKKSSAALERKSASNVDTKSAGPMEKKSQVYRSRSPNASPHPKLASQAKTELATKEVAGVIPSYR